MFLCIYQIAFIQVQNLSVSLTQASLMAQYLPANAGDAGSIPGSGRSPGELNGSPLQYSCWDNSMDKGA